MGLGTGDKVDTQEEEEGNEKFDGFEPQVSLNSSTHEIEDLWIEIFKKKLFQWDPKQMTDWLS